MRGNNAVARFNMLKGLEMTIKEDTLILWDNGGNKLWLFSVPCSQQYIYIEGIITVFDHYLTETVNEIENVYESLDGEFRLYDLGGDTDCYIDFKMLSLGKMSVSGRLGSTYTSNTLTFEFEADQTLLKPLARSLTVS